MHLVTAIVVIWCKYLNRQIVHPSWTPLQNLVDAHPRYPADDCVLCPCVVEQSGVMNCEMLIADGAHLRQVA